MKTMPRAIGALTLAGLLAVTGCGSDSGTDDGTGSQTSESAAPTGAPRGFDSEQLDEIRECLDAAGLDDVLPSDMPTDMPSDFPSDMPSEMPSDFPSEPPEGMPSGGPGGDMGALNDPEVQAALEACGIDLPQRPQTDPS